MLRSRQDVLRNQHQRIRPARTIPLPMGNRRACGSSSAVTSTLAPKNACTAACLLAFLLPESSPSEFNMRPALPSADAVRQDAAATRVSGLSRESSEHGSSKRRAGAETIYD